MKCAFRRRGILIGVLGTMVAGLFLGAGTSVAASGVPYTDTRAVGSVGLCNAAGQAITKGSIHDVPFVTKAIDSTPAAAPYNGPGETATLFIYQPRQSVQPAEWHGEQLGASGRSSTPTHPTAIVTAGDGPLAAVLSDYPPLWDGLMQLRIYLGAPNEPIYNSTYDATDIKITGDTWQVVRGDSVPCGNGQSVSLEQALASAFPQLTATPSPSGAGAAAANPSGKSPRASGKPRAATSAGTGTPASGDASAGASTPVSGSAEASTEPRSGGGAGSGSGGSHGGSSPVLWILIAVGVVGVGVAAIQWSRSGPVGTRRA